MKNKNKIQPKGKVVIVGSNATLTCSAPINAKVYWNFSSPEWPSNVFISKYSTVKTIDNQTLHIVLALWNASLVNKGIYRCFSEMDYIVEEDLMHLNIMDFHDNFTTLNMSIKGLNSTW